MACFRDVCSCWLVLSTTAVAWVAGGSSSLDCRDCGCCVHRGLHIGVISEVVVWWGFVCCCLVLGALLF